MASDFGVHAHGLAVLVGFNFSNDLGSVSAVDVIASVDYSLKNATETSIDSDYDNVEVKPANEKTAVSKKISILQIILIIFLVVFFIVVVCVIYAIIVTKKREKKYEARRMHI